MVDRAGDLAGRGVDRKAGGKAGDAVGERVAVRIGEALRGRDRDAGLAVGVALVRQRPARGGRHVLDDPGERFGRRRALVVGRGHGDGIGARRRVLGDGAGDHAGGRDREARRQARRRVGQRVAVGIRERGGRIHRGYRVAVVIGLVRRLGPDGRRGILGIDREGLRRRAAEAVVRRNRHAILAIERRAGAGGGRGVLRGVVVDRAGDLARRRIDRESGGKAGRAVGERIADRVAESLRRRDRNAGLAVGIGLVRQRAVLRRRHVLDDPGERLVGRGALVVGAGDDDRIGAGRRVLGDGAGDHACRRDREAGRQPARRIGQRVAVRVRERGGRIHRGDRVAVVVALV